MTYLLSSARNEEKRSPTLPQDARSPLPPTQPTSLFEILQRLWPTAREALKNVPISELKERLHAARVLRHSPELLAVMDQLDDEDATRTMLATKMAIDIVKDDWAAIADQDILDQLLDTPHDDAGDVSPHILDEARADPSFQEAPGDVTPAASAPTPSRLLWSQETATAIERHIRTYLADTRWTPLAQHFGAIVTDLQDNLWRMIMADADPIRYELAPDTAVTISLLKATIGPDHTDNLLGVTAWWEAMQLWVEETGRKEIPPAVIRQLAADFHLPLMQPAPQPKA